MIGTVHDPLAASTIAESFGLAARRARERANRSLARERQGQRAFSEPGYTENLLDEMELSIRTDLDRIDVDGLQIGATGFNFPVRAETEYGADIGMRIDIETPGYTVSKGLLFQCKRMYAGGDYPELRGRGEEQARSMAEITPASFFLLFNSGSQRDLAKLAWGDSQRSAEWFWGRPWHHFEMGTAAFDLGIAVIPAAKVVGLSWGAMSFDCTGRTILSGAVPFGIFMADLVCTCFVGDTRSMVLRLVTADRVRSPAEAEEPGTSVFDYQIRRYMHLSLVAGRPGEPRHEPSIL
ncbi:MAG TPA: hypothetical protein VFS20_22505 [Longimicrobium sp.]|nr:hypothetical protein [Longimicrobium sp.]